MIHSYNSYIQMKDNIISLEEIVSVRYERNKWTVSVLLKSGQSIIISGVQDDDYVAIQKQFEDKNGEIH